ncbi:MAG: DNA internalization-related competence protein ComEC/Rec2 [Clostridia bacterium]|nr:DNA internalization-related competence protein ComEC/Rec2 [Clostridia bacterium]
MKRKTACFALSFAITLIIAQLIPDMFFAFLTALCTFGGISVFLFVNRRKSSCFSLMSGVVFAISLFLIYPIINPAPEIPEKKCDFEATVIGYSYVNNYKTGVICDVEVFSINNAELTDKFTSKMYFNDSSLELVPGDVIKGSADFEIPKNDKDFNAYTYYKTKGIDTIAFCNDTLENHLNGKISVRFIPKWVSHNINLKLKELLPERLSGLVSAILLGDKTDFDSKDKGNFTTIGLAHVVAVSGMHLSFLAGFLFLFLGKRKHSAIFVIVILIFFTMVVGAPPSVVRALIMHILMILAPMFRGESDGINSLSVALILILTFNPYAVMDVGLQLSFLATLGIMVLGNRIDNYIKRPFDTDRRLFQKIRNFFTATLSSSIAAIIFTTPIVVLNFKKISLIAPVSNLLLILIVNIIFIASILVVIFAFIWMPIAKFLVIPLAFFAKLLLNGADLISKIPFANTYIDYTYQIVFLAYLYTVLILYIKDRQRHLIVPILAVSIVLIVTAVSSVMTKDVPEYTGVRFSVLDVGQGLSVMADYNGETVLVDCGGSRSKNAGDIAVDYLRKIGEDSLDALVITHFDSDHINGVKKLIENCDIEKIYMLRNTPDKHLADTIAKLASDRGSKIVYISRETNLRENGLNFTLFPADYFYDSNDCGLVTVFEKDDFEVVITGDLGKKSERELCDEYVLPDAEVYVAGHHGSKTSSSIELLNTILPEFAVISVEEDNKYGHPHSETMLLFESMGIKVARTDLNGDIIFYSDELIKEGN